MLEITALPSDVVHLMAAGEVIDSLAAAVRETAENALDADATRIVVDLYPAQWRLRVADNGVGMARTDLHQAAAPHSTSKIRTVTDLQHITSLGFRGEALHSLAQLSELTIASRLATASEGWQVRYDHQGAAISTEPLAIAPGTVITVDQLFANWQARRQAMPSLAQQLRAVQATLQQLALCHPHVTWQVQQSDRPWFTLWAGKSARQILPQMLRDVQLEDLQELIVELPFAAELPGHETSAGFDSQPATKSLSAAPQLYLLLGLPDRCHRRRPDWVRCAINQRCVQLPELAQTILSSLRRTLPRDRFPVCFLHLQVAPADIDWNRHPAKSEIYLQRLDTWREQVAAAIDQALRLSPAALPESTYTSRIGQLLKTAETEGGYLPSRKVSNETDLTTAAAESAQTIPLRAVAQLHNTYILVEHSAGIWLVEQHIAHERVLYEQLCDRWQIVGLPSPVTLSYLSPAQIEQLTRLGLAIEPFGEQIWAVRSAPAPLIDREDCPDALLELSQGGDLQTAQVAIACRTAIRNGMPLSLPEMQSLINQWQQTRNPRTCPHGRPICLNLEESSLARFFRRHWVIGKSHGI